MVSHVKEEEENGIDPGGDSLGFVCADATSLGRGKCYDWPAAKALRAVTPRKHRHGLWRKAKTDGARDFRERKQLPCRHVYNMTMGQGDNVYMVPVYNESP